MKATLSNFVVFSFDLLLAVVGYVCVKTKNVVQLLFSSETKETFKTT